jgi:hypothetical protein
MRLSLSGSATSAPAAASGSTTSAGPSWPATTSRCGSGSSACTSSGLNLCNEQIAQELGVDPDDAQVMASRLREGIVEREPEVTLSGEVECDEVYVVAGHKGHPAAVAKKGGPAAADG